MVKRYLLQSYTGRCADVGGKVQKYFLFGPGEGFLLELLLLDNGG